MIESHDSLHVIQIFNRAVVSAEDFGTSAVGVGISVSVFLVHVGVSRNIVDELKVWLQSVNLEASRCTHNIVRGPVMIGLHEGSHVSTWK